MNNHKPNSQPDASAPGNPSTHPTTQEQIDQRIDALMKRHLEHSYNITTDKECVYWILDLEDRMGMRLAQRFLGDAVFRNIKEEERGSNNVCHVSVATEFSCLRRLLLEKGESHLSPPAPGSHYLVAVTANSCTVASSTILRNGHQVPKPPGFMKNHRRQSQPEASAPGQDHKGRLKIQSEFSPEQILAAVTMRPLIEANPHEVYRSGRTMALTYYAANVTNNDSSAEELLRVDPAVSSVTKAAFDSERCRVLRKLQATHYACVFPLKADTELCTGCQEVLIVIGRSKDDQCVAAVPVFRDARGQYIELGEMFIVDVPHDGEPLIEGYFTQNATKASSHHSWNYIPGNN